MPSEPTATFDDRGRYTDPRVASLAIEYEFSGRKVNSEDIFTCLMEAFMILSYDGDVNFQALNAVRASATRGSIIDIILIIGVPLNSSSKSWCIYLRYFTLKRDVLRKLISICGFSHLGILG